ncbi:hypothetical protein COT82_00180 [Candidatus Campbellbacteria bacterium CG10_big_fil_rev_8_21_14_0_10_35_52]|uniref:Septum formation initiator n=1 Tax=Candidatus Campbellbacteria bacterium CG10_big_fil_rev_8_21_14_0_10_35_52 TaxID=1974527 RepID=A0A2M6WW25_9BACT|nr:MAG: hypothetical protein COT82_00180 [Candidatus Campbellbacteria bacterium CG10_big_fil_rev_8_21_14_0_10_35_52]
MDFYEKRKFKRLLYSKLSLIILALIVIKLSFSVFDMYKKERDTRLKRIEQKNILYELEKREKDLNDEIERLSSEKGIEEEIRSKFEVGKEGESVILIIDNPEDKNMKNNNTKKSFWQRLKDLF